MSATDATASLAIARTARRSSPGQPPAFSTMRSRRADFGITMKSFSSDQRIKTWAVLFPAFRATAFEDQSPILGAHAHQKSMGPLAVASIRLERTLAFHGGSARLIGGRRAVMFRLGELYYERSALAFGQRSPGDREVGRSDAVVLAHHARQRDFSRWIGKVFGDQPLAVAIGDVEERFRAGRVRQLPNALIKPIRERYEVTG